jgi:RNA methyltransferase, TrmH family
VKPDVICGSHAVAALFARRPDDVLRLFYTSERRGEVGRFCAMLAGARRPYRLVEPGEMLRVAGTAHHGGVCAVARPRDIPRFDPAAPPRVPFLVVLDGVANPHNLGAIARSAAFFGVDAMLLHETGGAAMPSSAAYRTAKGGLDCLQLFRTDDLKKAVEALASHYRTIASLLAPRSVGLEAVPTDRPVALVLGNEEWGVSPAVAAVCQHHVRIPGSGQVQSLNVAQAATILIHDGLARFSGVSGPHG